MNEAQLHNLVRQWIAGAKQHERGRTDGAGAPPSSAVTRVTTFMDTALRLFIWAEGASPDLRVEHRPEGPEDNLSHYLWWEATHPHRYLAISADQVSGQCWWSWGTGTGEALPWQEGDISSRPANGDEEWILGLMEELADAQAWSDGHLPTTDHHRMAA